MSETLKAPWIADYLINIAETYGCSLSNVPIHVKPGKKVQLLQFLTFRQFDEDDCVWAYVSDKHQRIAVRFSRHALNEYDKISQGNRLTQQRSAIATIKSFKPIFQRIPTGSVGKMTVSDTLALNVDCIQIHGGAGEPEFGSPRTLDNHNELNDWIEGLRAGDGSGNVLKLRKEKRLARERGESSVTGTPPIHERRDDRWSKHVDVRHYAALSEHKVYVKQEDWRESIAKKPLRFYKRPTAPKPPPTALVQKNGSLLSPAERIFKPGALDPDSSPDDSYDGSPSRSERQTTPSEWPMSPERTHIPVSPSRELADQLPISPPSTPPLYTQELPQVVGQSTSVPEPAGDRDPQATPEAVQQAGLTSLRPPVPAQKRTQSLPLPSSSSAVSSVTINPRHKATSLPTDIFGSTVSHMRRVPPPSAKTTKEPCGEVLVPGSDSGGPDTQSTQNNSSPSQRRAAIPVSPERVNTSLRTSSRRVNDAHDVQNSVFEPGPSQEPDKGQLDELSRMALNGSYADHVRGNSVQTHNGMGDNRRDAVEPGLLSPEPELSYEQLPPSSLPIYSQSLRWDRSMVAVEETATVEGTPSHVTTQHLPASITKRARPLTPSPPRGKRPRLMSYELVNRSREVQRKVFDPELLKVGVEVDLTDYDGNPPPHPCKEGMSGLNLKQPDQSLFITNSKLAEIWKSVCKHRGWCGTQSGGLQVNDLSNVSL